MGLNETNQKIKFYGMTPLWFPASFDIVFGKVNKDVAPKLLHDVFSVLPLLRHTVDVMQDGGMMLARCFGEELRAPVGNGLWLVGSLDWHRRLVSQGQHCPVNLTNAEIGGDFRRDVDFFRFLLSSFPRPNTKTTNGIYNKIKGRFRV